jgi:hypothetical protein
MQGSYIAREAPCLSLLWFTVGGKTLVISVKIGPFASKEDRSILAPLVASIAADT